MSEREGGAGVGPFLLGMAIGAALGYLFAPAPGVESRRRLAGRLRDLKELAGEEVDELRGLVGGGDVDDEDPQDEAESAEEPTAREVLERRLAAARGRRRDRRAKGTAGGKAAAAEEDEPVA